MPFPDSPRNIYQKNQLRDVVCELRFPSVLKIETQPPAEFQERIRKQFPIFTERTQTETQIPASLIGNFPENLVDTLTDSRKSYDFGSRDEAWTVSLSRQNFSLTTSGYTRWLDFEKKFAKPFRALVKLYEPNFFSRIGLRYTNIIRRSELGLSDCEWPELLEDHIVGMMGTDDIGPSILGMQNRTEIQLADGAGRVRITHGLVTAQFFDESEPEECFSIDSDFFTDKQVEVADALKTLQQFNRRASRLVYWCIKSPLEQAMDPKPIKN